MEEVDRTVTYRFGQRWEREREEMVLLLAAGLLSGIYDLVGPRIWHPGKEKGGREARAGETINRAMKSAAETPKNEPTIEGGGGGEENKVCAAHLTPLGRDASAAQSFDLRWRL